MKNIVLILGFFLLLTSACTLQAPPTDEKEALSPFGVNPTLEVSTTPTEVESTATSTQVPTSTLTFTPSFTPTPVYTPTATLVNHSPGELVAPILLYYRIAESDPPSRYSVSPNEFREQMKYLREQGYNAITISEFVLVLINGGALPAKPVVISFDDCDDSIYEQAFPILQEMGFVGVLYLTGNRLHSDGFLSPEQISEMTALGWQVGSQGMTHQDLTTLPDENLRVELLQSRLDLEEALEVRVTTFAYPFGSMNGGIADKLAEFGYYSAVGLGESSKHTWGTIYYLSRIEVQGTYTIDDFSTRLP